MSEGVLIGGPCRSMEGPLWEAFERCVLSQEGVEVWTHWLHDDGPQDGRVGKTHLWHEQNLERVAKLRQKFLDYFFSMDYEYAMMVDTDILMAKDTVQKMIHALEEAEAQVAYGVFWSDWGHGPRPQVWDIHPYGWKEDTVDSLRKRETVQVNGGGACTLFTKTAADLCRYHPRIDGLPQNGTMWRGEDRTFALCCEVHRLKQIALGNVDLVHLYSADQRTPEAIQKGLELVRQT